MEGHQLGRFIKQGPKSGSARTKRVAMVQSNLGFPADNVDELLWFLSESRWDQQSNLQYSPCKLKLDSIKCKSTSSAIASDLILKQRNLNSRAEMPLHYPQGTGGSKTPKKPYQDNVRSASCIRVRQNAGRQRLEGFTSAARFCESDAGTYRLHNQASVQRTPRKHVLQEVDQEPAFQKSGVQVQRNLQSRKALERPQPSHISDATLCSSFYKSSSQKEPHGGGGGINDLQFPLTLDDLAPICHLSTEERSTTLQAIIESSRTSASLHRSIMDFRDQDYQPESECAGPQSSGSFRAFPSCLTTSSLLDPGAIRNTQQSENNGSYTAQISCSVVHHLGEGEGHYPASKLATSLGRGMCVKRDACITEPLHPHSRFVNFDQSSLSDSESYAERFHFPDSTVAVSLVASIEPHQSQKKCIINQHGRNAEQYCDKDPGVIDLLAAQRANSSENTVFPKGPQSFNTTATDAFLRRHADSLPLSSLIQHHRVTMEELRGTKLSLGPDIFNCRSAMENSDLRNIKRSNEIEKLNTDICEESQLNGQLKPERETRDKIQSSVAGKDPERQSRNDRRVVVEQDQRASGSSLISSQVFEESYGFSRDDNGDERRSERGMDRSVGSVAQEPLKSSDPSVIHCLDPVERTEESLMKVHRHRLLAKCFNAWNSFVTLKSAAGRRVREGQVLHKGLVALNWAVAVRHMQADTIAARRKTGMLSQVFKQWKAAFAHRQKLVESTCEYDLGLEALRRRLIQPSEQFVLRTAYCVWRRQVTGSRIHRAAQIHYNLTLLWRYWLVWRQLRIRRNAQRQQTLALVYMESSLKRKAFTVWTAMMYKNRLAHSHYRSHTLSTVFRVWREQLLYVQAERSKQDQLSREFQNTTLLKQSFQHWRIKLTVQHMQLRRQQRITRITAHRWLQIVQQRKLEDLRLRANQLQNRIRLAAAFRTWCELKAAAETEQAREEEGRHLLGKKKMQVVFSTWHLCFKERQRLQPLRLQIQRRQLSGCFEAWRRLVLQKSLSRSRVDELQRQAVRQCFQHGRRLLQLHWQHKTFLMRVLEDRRQRVRETLKEEELESDPSPCLRAVQDGENGGLATEETGETESTARLCTLGGTSMAGTQREAVPQERPVNKTHTERRLLASCFTQWITNLQIAQQRQIALERSLIKQQNVQRAAVMQKWKLATRGSQAHRIHNTALLKQAFDQWKQAAEAARIAEQCSKEKEKRRLKLFYSSWSIWVKENKEQRLKCEVLRFHWQKRRMHHAFHQWITAHNNQAEADTLYQTNRMQRPFLRWMTVVQEQKQFSIVAARRIGTLQVKAAFNSWRARLEMHRALDSHLQKARQRTLRTAMRSWHHQVLSSQCRARYLCKKYYCRWTRVVSLGTQKDSEGVLHTRTEETCRRELGEKYLKKWRCAVLLKWFQRTQSSQRTERTWDQWRSLTGAVLFINNMCERRLLEKAWMRWRKRHIQAKVSQAFSAQQHRALLSEVFTAWRQVALSQKEDRGRVT